MAEYRLHCFGESGNAYKAALMLELTGCDWEPVPVAFMDGQTRDPAWRAEHNVMGEAPVLEHAGRRYSQSGVILDYLAERTGQFGPRDAEERREIWRWILFDNHKFTSYFATLRFLYGLQKVGDTPVVEFLRGRAENAWKVLEAQLSDGRDFVIGARPTIADLSLCGYLFFPEETGINRAAYPKMAAWAARIAALPRWRGPYDLMPRAMRQTA